MEIKLRRHSKRNSFERKRYAVLEVIEKGRHRKEIAEELDIHINTLGNWIRIYNEKGMDGLRPYQTPKRPNHQNDDAEIKRLREIEKKYNDQLLEIEILKKFQAFLKKRGNQ